MTNTPGQAVSLGSRSATATGILRLKTKHNKCRRAHLKQVSHSERGQKTLSHFTGSALIQLLTRWTHALEAAPASLVSEIAAGSEHQWLPHIHHSSSREKTVCIHTTERSWDLKEELGSTKNTFRIPLWDLLPPNLYNPFKC